MKPHNFYERLKAAQLRGNTPPNELKLLEEVAAEIERLNDLVTEIPTTIRRYQQRAEAAEAKLRAVERLPEKWRAYAETEGFSSHGAGLYDAAKELEAALRG